MLIHITADTDDALVTPVTLAAGDQILLDVDAAITAKSDAVTGPAGANGATMTFLGSVQSGSVAVNAQSGGHTITIGPNATMSGAEGAVVLDTGPNPVGNNIVKNAGWITTTSSVGDGIRADSSNNQVTNTGTITSSYGVSLGSTDINNLAITSNNTLVNSGTINGSFAVLIAGDGSLLDNSGTIKGFIPVELFGTGLGTITVKNTGTIETTNKIAIQGSTGADLINNAGVIKGSVFLKDGNDLYDGRMGSVVTGRVELEAGDDIAYGGLLADSLDGGEGNDTLEGAGGNDWLMGGGGIDTALFTGSDAAAVDLEYVSEQPTGYGLDTLNEIENLIGGSGADFFWGDHNANALSGAYGDDTLEGRLGDDTLDGSLGVDTAVFSGAAGATVNLAATGAQNTGYGLDLLIGIENLIGGLGADHFIGDNNSNVLNGGDGNDMLNGGFGIDTAVFDGVAGATVNLTINGGQSTGYGLDTLISIENLTGGIGSDHFIGDAGSNMLNGGNGDDTLSGGLGIDTAVFDGSAGAVVDLTKTGPQNTNYGMDVFTGIENLNGGSGADNFTGDGNANVLNGREGDDTLDGGAGIDTAMFDGPAGAMVDLNKAGPQNTHYGMDVLKGIENLSGGSGADHFIGDGNANMFDGGLGNDTLDGGLGIDTVVFSGLTGATVNLATANPQATGYGADTFISIENLIGDAGSDNFIGSSAANWLSGGFGSDLLNGGLGNDTLDGGSGLDVLRFTGSTGAAVNLTLKSAQNTGYGRDTILNFEALWGGTGADRFTGNSGSNAFIGEAGRDTISGGSGHDTLAGGTGSDRLSGGSGKDLFVFDTKLSKTSNVDTITDFKRVDDTFRLENAIFKKLTKAGYLNKSYFTVGTKAKDKNDFIVYDKAKGALYYDADGSGKGAAVKFAQVTKGTVLGYNDFLII